MKTKLFAICLFACTAVAVAYYPALQTMAVPTPEDPVIAPAAARPLPPVSLPLPAAEQQPKIEVVFVLDTTGSMGGLIQAAKDKIWSIASSMASAQQAPIIKMGLIGYRDRGDQYVTRVVDLSDDLDSTYATLMDFQADGGGDHPESVNRALYEAVNAISWSQDDSYKVVFLVGDAPPHMDYRDEVQYPEIIAQARRKGIVINTIQCGNMGQTIQPWTHIAQLGSGQYFQVAQGGSAIAVTTPFDDHIASLSRKLDATRLYYGNREDKARKEAKLHAAEVLNEKASVAAQARRGVFNVSSSGLFNLIGDSELLDDLDNGRVDLHALKKEHLPETMQAMSREEQLAFVKENNRKRKELTSEIKALAEQRQRFIREKVAVAGNGEASLDEKIYRAVRSQAKGKGLVYQEEDAKY